jgi:3-oxoacyl-[acyl-carrier protein] reductase
MGSLDGKVAVITGASRGIGEAIAIGFAREGAEVAVAARTADDLERVAGECRRLGAAPLAVTTDITREGDVENLVSAAVEKFGRIDSFVANAGTSYPNLTDKRYRELSGYDLDVVDQIVKVNLTGTWLCIKKALEVMKEGGSLITIGSETGRLLYPGAGIYSITKAAVDALTTLTAREAASQGVRVNCLSPGAMVDTHLFGPNKMPDFLKQQHGYLEPEVMVPAAVWLASDDSSGVTGAFLVAKEFNERPLEETREILTSAPRG